MLLNSNPLEQIENIGDITSLFCEGRLVHHVEPPARPDLASYVSPEPSRITYVDRTKATVTESALVTYDATRYDREGIRAMTYTDLTTGRVLRTETITSGPDLVTVAWTCSIPGVDTHLVAERKGPNVALSGRFRGEQVSRSYPLRGRIWMQWLIFDAATFIVSPMDRLPFVSIGTTGRGALTMTEFELTKADRETLTDATTCA